MEFISCPCVCYFSLFIIIFVFTFILQMRFNHIKQNVFQVWVGNSEIPRDAVKERVRTNVKNEAY